MPKNKRVRESDYEDATPHKKASPLVALTGKQEYYMDLIEQYPLVLATGWAGTAKTYIPARMACEFYLQDKQNHKIVICRPAQSTSNSLGFFKGDKEEKMLQWIQPVYQTLLEGLSAGQIKYLIRHDQLVMQPLETIKGSSYSDAFIIIDEAEDLTETEAMHIATRVGENSTCVVCGDVCQSDLGERNGLAKLCELRETNSNFGNICSHVDFDDPRYYKDGGDVVRSRLCSTAVRAFHGV